MTKFIRDPFTDKTFTLKDWEIEKQRRKEQMAREYHESHDASMDDNLTIHVGLPRTGTTFLQRNVFPNIKNVHFLHRGVPDNIRNIIGYEAIEGKINIISDELYTINNYSNKETNAFNIANRIKKIFPDAKIILVFREKNNWKQSLYKRYLEETKHKDLYEFNRWEKEILHDFDFNEYEAYLKKLFKKVLVLQYEDFKQDRKNFIQTMCDFIGCPVPKYTFEIVNKSLDKKQLTFIKIIRNIDMPGCLKEFLATLTIYIFGAINRGKYQ